MIENEQPKADIRVVSRVTIKSTQFGLRTV